MMVTLRLETLKQGDHVSMFGCLFTVREVSRRWISLVQEGTGAVFGYALPYEIEGAAIVRPS